MLVTGGLLISSCLMSALCVELQHTYYPYHQHHSQQRGVQHRAPSHGVRREDKKLFNGYTASHKHRHTTEPHNLQSNVHRTNLNVKRRPYIRATRKIETAPFKLDKQFLKDKSDVKKKYKAKLESKYKATLAGADDNLAVESKIFESRVKPETAAPRRKKYSVSKPKFIIKQAGPSQQFGWVGHGKFAPLNIPNIFAKVGLNTAWVPGVNSVFPVGLTYPAPPSSHPLPQKVQPTKTSSSTTVAPPAAVTTKVEKIPVYQPSSPTSEPARRPPKQNEIETLYYGSQIVNLYTPPVKTTTSTYSSAVSTTTTKPTTTPTTTAYKAVTTTAGHKYTYKTYKTTTVKPPPAYRYPTTPQTYFSASTRAPPSYSSPSFYGPSSISPPSVYSTKAPYYGSPSPPSVYSTKAPYYGSPSTPHYGYGSPQPSLAPHHYQQPGPSSVRPFTAFTAFSRSTQPPPKSDLAPIIGIIETEEQKTSSQPNEGEVFYIFYENEDLPQKTVQSGLDLKRYIHEEIANQVPDDNVPSESILRDTKEPTERFPNFALIEEINKPEPAVFYDVPIKIEETGEGFDPPSEIRTIYVPIENAINVPENFNIDVGTSFGSAAGLPPPAQNKALRKVRKLKPSVGQLSQPYYGSRLDPRHPADPLL